MHFALPIQQKISKWFLPGKKSKYNVQQIASVKMLGSNQKLNWQQNDDTLVITNPTDLPPWQVIEFKIEFKK
ncbi:MAG: hypothetical protein ABIO55_08345 [Ginsengibacter sp.]